MAIASAEPGSGVAATTPTGSENPAKWVVACLQFREIGNAVTVRIGVGGRRSHNPLGDIREAIPVRVGRAVEIGVERHGDLGLGTGQGGPEIGEADLILIVIVDLQAQIPLGRQKDLEVPVCASCSPDYNCIAVTDHEMRVRNPTDQRILDEAHTFCGLREFHLKLTYRFGIRADVTGQALRIVLVLLRCLIECRKRVITVVGHGCGHQRTHGCIGRELMCPDVLDD